MRHWQRVTALSAALYSLSLVYGAVTAARRAAYGHGTVKAVRIAVPVVVIGNVYVGGTGKTPLVLWLARFLRAHGRQPGIVSRGYGGRAAAPIEVTARSDPADVGDEPLLIARRSGCPVWIGRNRVAAAQALLAARPECDVVISDDGLQHYRLARDVEIAVVDGERGLGNGLLLPAGPLREPASRLDSVDAVIVNRGTRESAFTPSARGSARTFAMTLRGARFYNLTDPAHEVGPEYFQGRRVHAIAGIGNPPRFFAHLEALGIAFEAHAFADHHAYRAADLHFGDADAVLMTEKDAVKCAAFARPVHWVLPVDADPDPAFGELVLRKLNTIP
jgi:tetraacyldisaccharide 4'-kinase